MKDIEKMLSAGPLPVQDEEQQAARLAQRLSAHAISEGLADIGYATVDSPFGTLTAAATDGGLVRLAFPEEPLD
ncbi:MAG TPA: hypothetical protein VID70_07335, partial [Solirubrobacteraceae bacterium]